MKIYDKIKAVVDENNIACEMWAEDDNAICVQINWGDWKHDHLALKLAVTESCQPTTCISEVIEENGSDCFSAVHRFIFKKT